MLGGTEVLVSGPCFPPGSGILCKFDDVIVDGFMVKYFNLMRYINLDANKKAKNLPFSAPWQQFP